MRGGRACGGNLLQRAAGRRRGVPAEHSGGSDGAPRGHGHRDGQQRQHPLCHAGGAGPSRGGRGGPAEGERPAGERGICLRPQRPGGLRHFPEHRRRDGGAAGHGGYPGGVQHRGFDCPGECLRADRGGGQRQAPGGGADGGDQPDLQRRCGRRLGGQPGPCSPDPSGAGHPGDAHRQPGPGAATPHGSPGSHSAPGGG